MSKIGRKPIELGNVQIELEGQLIHYKGPRASGVYDTLPTELKVEKRDNELHVVPCQETRDINRIWGLHRALLANCIKGAAVGFTKQVEIVGLGYKASVSGSKVVFSLGYSHKVDFDLPDGVSLTIDKTGQMLTFASANRELLGSVCGRVKELRPTEPYKGTGIKLANETIVRKAGKTKSA